MATRPWVIRLASAAVLLSISDLQARQNAKPAVVEVLWQFEAGGPLAHTPAVAGNALYIGSATASSDGSI